MISYNLKTSLLDNLCVHIDNYNNDFLIIKSEESLDLRAVGRSIFEQKFDFVNEVIVTESEICIQLNSKFETKHISQINAIKTKSKREKRRYLLPVYFENQEDWLFVKSFSGLTMRQIIEQLIASKFSIAMFGFLPGFIYLSGLEKALQVPRKSVPSKYIKANSIALGGKYLGLYALESPGGWHVIGKTPIAIFDIKGLPPVPMNLEDEIRIVEIDKEEFEHIANEKMSLLAYNKDK